MQQMTMTEVEAVSGGVEMFEKYAAGAGLTVGLMALAVSSPIVIGAGVVALAWYATGMANS